MFMVPRSSLPDKLIIKYSYWNNNYNLNDASLKKKYEKSLFFDRGISL